jgi:hypothetical protein
MEAGGLRYAVVYSQVNKSIKDSMLWESQLRLMDFELIARLGPYLLLRLATH